jgi:hypothetical protein
VALKVFISYARKDASAFAEDLLAGLEAAGFEAFLDRHDIAAGEDWEARLDGLIAQADTVLFVVTPSAVRSERCAWEVARAEALNKRVLPIVAIEVDSTEIPPSLSRRNFIYFSRQTSFGKALYELATALRTDVEWLREHTRLAELARRWRDRSETSQLLLRGAELEAARAWLQNAPADESVSPTALQRDFIHRSTDFDSEQLRAERERLEQMAANQAAKEDALRRLSRRTVIGLAGTGTLAIAAGGLAYWGTNAESRFREAQITAQEAARNSREAAIVKEATRTDISGQIVAYAAAPGTAALDGIAEAGGGSPFTYGLIPLLDDRDTSLLQALMVMQDRMKVLTGGRQRPFVGSDLNGDLFFSRPSPTRKLSALVVSGEEYDHPNLRDLNGTGLDGDRWEQFLHEHGFDDVQRLRSPTFATFAEALGIESETSPARFIPAGPAPLGRREPKVEVAPDTLMVLCYAGHGFALNGREYLPCADTSNDVFEGGRGAIDLNIVRDSFKARFQASVILADTNFPEEGRPAKSSVTTS